MKNYTYNLIITDEDNNQVVGRSSGHIDLVNEMHDNHNIDILYEMLVELVKIADEKQ